MSSAIDNIAPVPQQPESADKKAPRSRRHTVRRVLKAMLWVFAGIIILVALILASATLLLTPDRLTGIINKAASEWLDADIKTHNVRYTLWSSFPRLVVQTDSVEIISRSLRGVPDRIRRQLPDNADSLASLKAMTAQINVIDMIYNRYMLRDVEIAGLKLNLVAYNDSVNNFSILPDRDTTFTKVPYLTANRVRIVDSGGIRYFSASTNTSAAMRLQDFSLLRTHRSKPGSRHHEDDYNLRIEGTIRAIADRIPVLDGFPFLLDGKLSLRFDPFGISLHDYSIDLGNVKSKLTMNLGVGDGPALEQFDYQLSTLNLMKILGYLPEKYLPVLTGISADLPVDASARLTAPWKLSSSVLPQIRIDFRIPQGRIAYTVSDASDKKLNGRTFHIEHSPMHGILDFDGSNPARSVFTLLPFTISSEGMRLNSGATVSNLTADPKFIIDLKGSADLKRALHAFAADKTFSAGGLLDVCATVGFNLSDFSDNSLSDGLYLLSIDGNASLKGGSLSVPAMKLQAKAGSVKVDFGAGCSHLVGNTLTNSLFNAVVRIDGASADFQGSRLLLDGFSLRSKVSAPGCSTAARLADELPPAASFTAEHIGYTDSVNSVDLRGFAGDISVKRRKKAYRLPEWSPDYLLSASDEEVPHTPETLTVSVPEPVRQFLTGFDFGADMKFGRMEYASKGQSPDMVSNAEISVHPDGIRVARLDADIMSTKFSLAGTVTRLRDFLLDPVYPRPLDLRLDLALDTVNINSLAHDYFMARGGIPSEPVVYKPVAADSVAVLLPRNISAIVNASAKGTVYTNLRLYDLSTQLLLRKGVAKVQGLNISSDFGHGALDLTYDTSDIDGIRFFGDVALTKVNIVNFFKNFHTLLLMMPQMKNLTGEISVTGNFGGSLFPDMVLNAPALFAEMNVRGTGLKVHQNHFIRRITKMMLINNDKDLHIKDMNVYAHVHGNLLQVDPFIFEFDAYKLRMLGINNFNGNLYYHIGLLKNPFDIPFSINIEGLFRHPELRFGGTHYDTRRAMRISQSIMEQNDQSIVGMVKNFMQAFLRKAAQAAEDPGLTL